MEVVWILLLSVALAFCCNRTLKFASTRGYILAGGAPNVALGSFAAKVISILALAGALICAGAIGSILF